MGHGKSALGGRFAAASFIWGFAEATFFVVVPDVLLSAIAQRCGFWPAARAAVLVALGAVLGGGLMYFLGAAYPAAIRSFLDILPAISPKMIGEAADILAEAPLAGMLHGAFSGVPYKVFAAVAAEAGVRPLNFLLLSIPARLTRFLLVAGLVAALDRILANWLTKRTRTVMLGAAWSAFYVAYWTIMPW